MSVCARTRAATGGCEATEDVKPISPWEIDQDIEGGSPHQRQWVEWMKESKEKWDLMTAGYLAIDDPQ